MRTACTRFRLFTPVAIFLIVGTAHSSAQSTAAWLRGYKGTSASSVVSDPRFARDIHRYLSAGPAGGDLAETTAANMTIETGDDVHVDGSQVTVAACAIHGGECAMLWADSQKTTTRQTVLALCVIETNLWVHVSSRSITALPPKLIQSIQTWRSDLVENGFFLSPSAAFVVTSDGRSTPINMDTLLLSGAE